MYMDVLNKLTSLTNGQKIDAIKQFTQQGNNDIDILDDIKDNVVLHSNNISLAPSFPYVIDIVSKVEIFLNSKETLTSALLENTSNSSIKDTDFWADMSKTITAIHWQTKISLVKGIEKTINYKK